MISTEDFSGRTPLAWVAHNGCEEGVKILLEWEDVSPDKPNNSGWTPLTHASSGHKGVVKILLEGKQANPNKPSNYGRTPASLAA